MTLEATGPSGAVATYATPTASDLVDGAVAVSCAPASGSTFALGTTPVNCSATDAHGNTASTSFNVNVQDTTPPSVSCGSADGVWHASDVSIACTASDIVGLADPLDANFSLSTLVPAGTETNNAATNSHAVCDGSGNCTTAGPISGNKVDKKAPTITLTTPSNGASYLLNQNVAASYSCSDGGSGVASCTGPVANGSNIDTASVGSKSFTVNATDAVGNVAVPATNSYSVIFAPAGMCLAGPGHQILQPIELTGVSVFVRKQGSTVPTKFRVCDANGVSIGPSPVVSSFVLLGVLNGTVIDPTPEDIVATNSDTAFRWDGEKWIFNLSTKNLPAGKTYVYRINLIDGTYIQFQFGLK